MYVTNNIILIVIIIIVRWLSKKIRTNWIKAPNFQDIIFRHFDMI